MSGVIRGFDSGSLPGEAFNFDDLQSQAQRFLENIRAEAKRIVEASKQQAVTIRQQAEQEGLAAGEKVFQQRLEKQINQRLATALPAVQEAAKELKATRGAWLATWEQRALDVAIAIAERICRRQIAADPTISMTWIRESLELAAGAPRIDLHLHPEDINAWGQELDLVLKQFAQLAPPQITPDPTIGKGGCRVTTHHGVIDQQLETQLQRLREELL